MQACGHCASTAIALGAATVLNQIKDRVKLVFQPNEEGLGGAQAMIKDGVFEDPAIDIALDFHNWSPLEAGKVAYQEGAVVAASDFFDITLIRGGRACRPSPYHRRHGNRGSLLHHPVADHRPP